MTRLRLGDQTSIISGKSNRFFLLPILCALEFIFGGQKRLEPEYEKTPHHPVPNKME